MSSSKASVNVERNDPLNVGMFIGLLQFMIGEPEAQAAFEEKTGITSLLSLPATTIGQVDYIPTDSERADIIEFAEWVAEHYWDPNLTPDMDLVFPPSSKSQK